MMTMTMTSFLNTMDAVNVHVLVII